MNYSKQVVNLSGIVFFFSILTAGLSFFIRFYFARTLGTDMYGLFFAGIAFVSFILLFTDLGTSATLMRFIAEFTIKKQFKKLKQLISIMVIFLFSTSVIVGLVVYFLADYLAINFFHSPGSVLFIKLLAVLLFFLTIERFFKYVFLGFKKPYYFSISNFVKSLLIILFAFFFFMQSPSPITAIYAYLLAHLIVFIGSLILTRYLFPKFKKYNTWWENKLFKRVIIFGMSLFLILISNLIITNTDTLMLTYFRSLAEVGFYQAALPTSELLKILPTAITFVLTPLAASLFVQKKRKDIKQLYELVQNYMFIFIIPIGFLFMFFAPLVLRVSFGAAYENGGIALTILTIANLFMNIALINNSFFYALEKPQLITKFFFLAVIINLILNFILIPLYGIIGAASATAISYLFILVSSSRAIGKYDIRLPYMKWLLGLIAGILFVGAMYLIKKALIINLWYVEAFIVLCAGLIVYLILLFLFRLISKKEIRYVLALVQQKTKLPFIHKVFK